MLLERSKAYQLIGLQLGVSKLTLFVGFLPGLVDWQPYLPRLFNQLQWAFQVPVGTATATPPFGKPKFISRCKPVSVGCRDAVLQLSSSYLMFASLIAHWLACSEGLHLLAAEFMLHLSLRTRSLGRHVTECFRINTCGTLIFEMHVLFEGKGKANSMRAVATMYGVCSIFQSHCHYETCDVSLCSHRLPANAQSRLSQAYVAVHMYMLSQRNVLPQTVCATRKP